MCNQIQLSLAARLQQQDAIARVGGKAVREHATGRARADNDVIELRVLGGLHTFPRRPAGDDPRNDAFTQAAAGAKFPGPVNRGRMHS